MSGALTTADLHLAAEDDSEDHDEYTESTDGDDSFLENSSLKRLMKTQLNMLDSLTDEVMEIVTTTNKSSRRTSTDEDNTPAVVAPANSTKSTRSLNDFGGAAGKMSPSLDQFPVGSW